MARNFLAAAARALRSVITDVTDPRKLKPGELCRILNSTPQGAVIDDRRLRAQRTRAGLRIGEPPTIDLFRYAAWLAGEYVSQETPAAAAPPAGSSYDRKREAERDRQAKISRSGRDIGPVPQVVDPKRRAKGEKSLRFFCEAYFPQRFDLGWSRDHLKVIERMEEAVLRGGLFAIAMPRGSGKTTLSECAAIWGLLRGARKFVMLIGASAEAAASLLDAIKAELECNDYLFEDFPEVCYPIRQLEGRANLCAGQLSQGERTHITYGKKVLVLPTIPGSKASSSILKVSGITGAVRGARFRRRDGTIARPDLVIIDDPQTHASAKSDLQCGTREKIVSADVLGMAGPGKKIAAIMPCTVIRRGDMAHRMLDRTIHPAWRGETTKLIYKFPTNEKLWEEYREIRNASLRNGGDGSEATTFYRKHRKAMDAGAEVAWPERHNEDEISGLQSAMNLRLTDEATFYAEYQNEPLDDQTADEEMLPASAIAAKVNGLKRGVVPLWATRLTAFVDVQHRLLYWAVAAWGDDFTGAIVDYGAWPDQQRSHFQYRAVKKTLQARYKQASSTQAAVRAGLADLAEALVGRRWKTENGTETSIDRLLVDAADGNLTDEIFDWCRNNPYPQVILPAHGKGIGASDKPMHQYAAKPGERLGYHWLLQPVPKRGFRQLIIDSNFWKSFIHDRLRQPLGDKACLSLFGDRRADHRMLSEHLTSEKRERLRHERTQRVVDVWKLPPNKPDNHFLDCVCGAAVAASLAGASLTNASQPAAPPRRLDVRF